MFLVDVTLHPTALLTSSVVSGDISAHTFPYKIPPFSAVAFFLDTGPLKMGPIGSPETSVLNRPTLRTIPEDDRTQLCLLTCPKRFP